jgi:CO/xanthine dehydrogenase Mo-binding subunit/aerobic-type carbon monoxide dehydrogenase small subunit (CoxS/CutS family)
MPEQITVRLTVNDQEIEAQVSSDMSLLEFLRNKLKLTGTKNGCASGHCGACTVILNGKATRSCLVRMGSQRMAGARVETIEGLGSDGRLHPLQAAFIEHGAVQCGFCTPGMLMVAKALLDANPKPSDEEIKGALTRNRNLCRCTGYVKIIEAIQDAATRLAAGKAVVDLTGLLAGERGDLPRLGRDAVGLVTGATQFGDDLELEGMLHGKILWSAYPHAEILGIDTSWAEAMEGVALVVTAKDIPGENRAGLLKLDQPAIAAEKVRFIGDPVAAVFAETQEIAEAALEKIQVNYRPLPGVFSPEAAARPDAPQVHEEDNLLHHARIVRGDVEAAFQRCDVVVENTYTTPRIEHAFLEPEAGIGIPTDDGGIFLKMGTQCAFDDRTQLARILALPEEKIRIVQLPMGGAFGAKEDILIYQFLALGALLSQRPVKITLTRAESLRTHPKRHPARMRFKTGGDAEGRLLAVEAEITLDGGAYASLSVDVLENAVVFACGPYYVPNVKLEGWVWYTNNVPSGAMRGFGVNQVCFAMESNLDEIARRLAMDPFEIRELNALDVGLPTVADHVLQEGVVGIKPTIVAAKRALKELPLPEQAEGKRIGVGVASAVKNIGFGHGLSESAGAEVELDSGGRVRIRASQHEYGQGAHAGLVRLASEELVVPADCIELIGPDTALTPPTGPTTASRQTFMTGNAVLMACRTLKEELFARAAEALDTDPTHIRIEDDSFVETTSGRTLKISELGERFAIEWRYEAPPSAPLLEDEPSYYGQPDFESRPTHWCYSYSTHVAMVEVDEKIGEVRVLKVIAAHDLGKVINRGAVERQIHGGVVQGLGYALSEQFLVEQGINVTDTLRKCGVPTADQTSEIIPILVEVPHPQGPLGAKGIAETPSLATAPAILNAIYDAVGARITSLPATRERVLEAIEKARVSK